MTDQERIADIRRLLNQCAGQNYMQAYPGWKRDMEWLLDRLDKECT